jgi:hypothetical protein
MRAIKRNKGVFRFHKYFKYLKMARPTGMKEYLEITNTEVGALSPNQNEKYCRRWKSIMQISYPGLYQWATSSCEVYIEIKLFKQIFSPFQQIGKKKG